MLKQAFKSVGYDNVDQLVESVTEGNRSVVAKELEASLHSVMSFASRLADLQL